MNKQAFAFLTLFTLILMLSIYYVTLPADQGQLNPDQLLTGQNEDQDSLATMQQQLQDKHNAQAQNSQSIVASPSASTEEKQDALQQAGQVEQNKKTEETIVAALSQAGMEGCVAELEDEVVRIGCPKTLAGAENASKIMKIAADQLQDERVLEVTFK